MRVAKTFLSVRLFRNQRAVYLHSYVLKPSACMSTCKKGHTSACVTTHIFKLNMHTSEPVLHLFLNMCFCGRNSWNVPHMLNSVPGFWWTEYRLRWRQCQGQDPHQTIKHAEKKMQFLLEGCGVSRSIYLRHWHGQAATLHSNICSCMSRAHNID